MTGAERARAAHALLERALELDAEARPAFLDEACGEDADLRARVEALLAADAGSEDFFADLARRVGVPGQRETPPGGERIGPYRVLRELGRGGMGVVYLARRDDGQFEQTVALKLIRRGMDDEAARRRFLRERQILARLQHPAIARIYDGGVTEDGQPWFAMEAIEGRPIDRYCDAGALDIDARLRLFHEVGRAVQYAHGNLVVHRDLKPGNILVTEDGTVKLLDFGIATLLDDAGDAATTRTVTRALTPAWSSPEQMRGDTVTTATDVYALGLVLYELLTGRRAHAGGGTPEALTQAVLERTPDRPSAVVRGGGDAPDAPAPAALARLRGTTPTRLARRLTGDLDTICLTALRKEPERRYASVEALVEDIDRHRQGLPVRARPETLGYRLRKFAGRNRVAVAAGIVLILALAGGLAASLWQSQALARERDTAETVTAFLIDLFETADPSVSRGEEVTARELLDRGAERVERELAGQPDVQARMLSAVGQVYLQLGLYDNARPLLARVVDQERTGTAGELDQADAEMLLGAALEGAGEPDSARALFEDALRIRRARLGASHPAVAETMFELASLLHTTADRARGDTLFEEWMALQERLSTAPSTEQAARLLQAGQYLRGRERLPEAERYMRDALAMSRALHGDAHPAVVASLLALGGLLINTDRLDEARQTYTQAARVDRTLYPDGHEGYVMSLLGLSTIARRQDRLEEADSLLGVALDVAPGAAAIEDFQVATLYYNRGQVRYALERHEDARSDFANAASIWAGQLGAEHVYVMHAKAAEAHALRDAGRYAEAEPLYREAERGYTARYGPDHERVGSTMLNRGKLYRMRGDTERAEAVFRDAVRILATVHGEDAVETAEARLAWGESLADLGRFEEAAAVLEASHAALVATSGEADPRTLRAARALTDVRSRAPESPTTTAKR